MGKKMESFETLLFVFHLCGSIVEMVGYSWIYKGEYMTGRKKLDRLKKTITREDGKIVVNASKETHDRVKEVCEEYVKNKRSIDKVCEDLGWRQNAFYRAIGQYGDCKAMANRVGLGLRGDAEVVPAKLKIPDIPEGKNFTIFDLEILKKDWTQKEKKEAIKELLAKLSLGIPLAYACAIVKIPKETLQAWCVETPELVEVIRSGDAELIEKMFGWLTIAGEVAAKQGKFSEILKGVEQRLPEKWGTIDKVEVSIMRGKEESILSLSATDAKDVGFEIEEK